MEIEILLQRTNESRSLHLEQYLQLWQSTKMLQFTPPHSTPTGSNT